MTSGVLHHARVAFTGGRQIGYLAEHGTKQYHAPRGDQATKVATSLSKLHTTCEDVGNLFATSKWTDRWQSTVRCPSGHL